MTRDEMNALYAKLNEQAKAEYAAVEAAKEAALAGRVLSDRQSRMVTEALRRLFQCSSLNDASSAEFKKLEVEMDDRGCLRVVAEVGRKNDEGTVASVFCRYHKQFWVTKRGGIHAYSKRMVYGRAALKYIGSMVERY